MYVLKDSAGRIIAKLSDYAGSRTSGAIYVKTDCPGEYYTLAADNKTWIPDEARHDELLQLAADKIKGQAKTLLAAGIEFDGAIFPLSGDPYAQNMAAINVYLALQQTQGCNLYTNTGNYALVTNVRGLIESGYNLATGISMDAVNQINALSGKTTAELIQFINNQQ